MIKLKEILNESSLRMPKMIMSHIKDIEKYDINQKIKIIVKAVRFKFNTNKIQLVGNIYE